MNVKTEYGKVVHVAASYTLRLTLCGRKGTRRESGRRDPFVPTNRPINCPKCEAKA